MMKYYTQRKDLIDFLADYLKKDVKSDKFAYYVEVTQEEKNMCRHLSEAFTAGLRLGLSETSVKKV